ncbi:LptE family protein [Mucilaginibacter sabulilitoris]|uniref:LptE family protein n=1 Tax=Mucilaginibacter sabulilitoris TaxID=1173583 RepID=A0ABZ0TP46_9SPHI|nr:LptE family protein [Mucilaginibacter sabulilitoris]WPU93499.1 LptE family protein [Mucilaginibacter sabulilitoris]
MKRFFSVVVICSLSLFLSSCYTLKNASIPPALKTIDVQFFENNAPLVVNNLSQTFTEALKDRIRTQSRLSITRNESDATMSGSITGYTIAPVSIEAVANNVAPIADANRLTITVQVKFVYEADKKLNFDQAFTSQTDFRGDIGAQEQTLIQDLVKKLTEDIFNKAFSNW